MFLKAVMYFTKMMLFQKEIHPIVYCKIILTDRHIDHRDNTKIFCGHWTSITLIDLGTLKGCANISDNVPLRNYLFSLPVVIIHKWVDFIVTNTNIKNSGIKD